MFTTLLIKEMHETLITWRFALSSLLLIVLIPLGIMVTLEDYHQRLDGYNEAVSAYQQKSEGNVGTGFRAEGFRPPSPLSVFVSGIEHVMPDKARSGRYYNLMGGNLASDGMVEMTNETVLDSPLSELFGKMDFLFNVSIVLSILAFVFTYSCIAGEKEQGTLKQTVANSVERWRVLLAKVVGNFLLLIVPFIVATLIGLILLNLSDVFTLTEPQVSSGIFAIIGVSIVFLFCMFTMGVLISTSNNNSLNAIITLMLIWVVIALVIPRVTPVLAAKIHPVISKEVLSRQIESLRKDYTDEINSHQDEIREQAVAANGLTMSEYNAVEWINGRPEYSIGRETRDTINADYEALMTPIREENAARFASEISSLLNNYDNQQAIQQQFAMQLSRVSPVSCLTYILTAIASTGPYEVDRFSRKAEQFQDDFFVSVKNELEKVSGNSRMPSLPVPHMTGYRHASLGDAFANTWIDLLLLGLYTVLFFAGAFMKFIRYDVR